MLGEGAKALPRTDGGPEPPIRTPRKNQALHSGAAKPTLPKHDFWQIVDCNGTVPAAYGDYSPLLADPRWRYAIPTT